MSVSPDCHNRVGERLRPTLVAEPLRSRLKADPTARHHVIIDLNTRYPGGVEAARQRVRDNLLQIAPRSMERNLPGAQNPYVFAQLSGNEIDQLMKLDFDQTRTAQAQLPLEKRRPDASVPRESRAIFKIWESARIRPLTTVSIRTVKADAAQSAFAATGDGIVWAVLDSGINRHSHFRKHQNLDLDAPLVHRSFVTAPDGTPLDALNDGFGHGTHVAGIIAGALDDMLEERAVAQHSEPALGGRKFVAQQSVDETGKQTEYHLVPVKRICGMAPMCKLLSLRVLDDSGAGDVTAVINALEWIIQLNGDGSKPLVHGVNLSAGYLPDPENYGSGQSPICRQVNRAVRSGVVVVVAAGNFGYATYQSVQASNRLVGWDAGAFASVADPGNADLAITVGSTHREEPHRYGVSYFSSKGPTSDGRLKPDVVAPGERIISCAAGAAKEETRRRMQGGAGDWAASAVAAGAVGVEASPGAAAGASAGASGAAELAAVAASVPAAVSRAGPAPAAEAAAVASAATASAAAAASVPAEVSPAGLVPAAASTAPPASAALATPDSSAVSASLAGSAASGASPPPAAPDFDYIEDSGTSMAAPHVSGVIAAFMSIRREFIGEPEAVSKLVVSSAMDLKREPRLQGAGLVDLFKMLQSV